jgi:hypothetical protein
MVIQMGTSNVGRLHEAIQANLIISNIALGTQVQTIYLWMDRRVYYHLEMIACSEGEIADAYQIHWTKIATGVNRHYLSRRATAGSIGKSIS